jgi:ribosome-associated protein
MNTVRVIAKRQEQIAIVEGKQRPADPGRLLSLVHTSLDDDKAEDIVVIDLRGKSSIADYMVIATGRSDRHVGAIAEHLLRRVKEAGYGTCRAEGKERGDWVLIDAGDVIVHLFRPEVRAFYNLEKMWSVDMSEPESLAV